MEDILSDKELRGRCAPPPRAAAPPAWGPTSSSARLQRAHPLSRGCLTPLSLRTCTRPSTLTHKHSLTHTAPPRSCLNAKSLGETKNVNLPGVHVDMLVLTDKDVDDVSGGALVA